MTGMIGAETTGMIVEAEMTGMAALTAEMILMTKFHSDHRRHPSGRPIRREEVRGRQIWRIPDEGPVIPRLRVPPGGANAIGFRARITSDEEEDNEVTHG